jgi:hypothetical protein
MDMDLLKLILQIAIVASAISTPTIQKVKELIPNKTVFKIVAVIISIGLGVGFSVCFSELNSVQGLWVGLITWVGADAIYKTFEEKIFKSYDQIHIVEEIERTDVNENL